MWAEKSPFKTRKDVSRKQSRKTRKNVSMKKKRKAPNLIFKCLYIQTFENKN